VLDAFVERLIRADLVFDDYTDLVFVKTDIHIIDKYSLRELTLRVEAVSNITQNNDMPLFFEEYKILFFNYKNKDGRNIIVYAYCPSFVLDKEYDREEC